MNQSRILLLPRHFNALIDAESPLCACEKDEEGMPALEGDEEGMPALLDGASDRECLVTMLTANLR